MTQPNDSAAPRLATEGETERIEALETDDLPHAEEIGDQIRQLRKAKGLTLQDLAERIGMSIGYVSQVERNRSTLTVAALKRISEALGVGVTWFFRPGSASDPAERDFIVRAGNRRRMSYTGLGLTDELMSPDLNGPLELLYCRIEPGASSGEEPYSHAGAEAGMLVSGTLDLWIGERRFRLEPGDSFSFRSSETHRYRNPGKVTTEIVWVITPPSY
jgi:transcriptional regulator with XRE-family HTH domain